jgi:hypothetical protein
MEEVALLHLPDYRPLEAPEVRNFLTVLLDSPELLTRTAYRVLHDEPREEADLTLPHNHFLVVPPQRQGKLPGQALRWKASGGTRVVEEKPVSTSPCLMLYSSVVRRTSFVIQELQELQGSLEDGCVVSARI